MEVLVFFYCICISKTYSMDCYFRQSWVDRRLAFHAAQDTLALSISMLARIWKPDTYFYNGKQSYLHTITTPNKFVRLHQDGRVLYSSRWVLILVPSERKSHTSWFASPLCLFHQLFEMFILLFGRQLAWNLRWGALLLNDTTFICCAMIAVIANQFVCVNIFFCSLDDFIMLHFKITSFYDIFLLFP